MLSRNFNPLIGLGGDLARSIHFTRAITTPDTFKICHISRKNPPRGLPGLKEPVFRGPEGKKGPAQQSFPVQIITLSLHDRNSVTKYPATLKYPGQIRG